MRTGTVYHPGTNRALAYGKDTLPPVSRIISQGGIFIEGLNGTAEGQWLKRDPITGNAIPDTDRIQEWEDKRNRQTQRHQQFDIVKSRLVDFLQNTDDQTVTTAELSAAVKDVIRLMRLMHRKL